MNDAVDNQHHIQYFTFKCFAKVNNAATAKLDSFMDETLEQFDLIMSTNIRAVYQLTKLAVPHLIESKGSIVNVSSILGAIAVSHMINVVFERST